MKKTILLCLATGVALVTAASAQEEDTSYLEDMLTQFGTDFNSIMAVIVPIIVLIAGIGLFKKLKGKA